MKSLKELAAKTIVERNVNVPDGTLPAEAQEVLVDAGSHNTHRNIRKLLAEGTEILTGETKRMDSATLRPFIIGMKRRIHAFVLYRHIFLKYGCEELWEQLRKEIIFVAKRIFYCDVVQNDADLNQKCKEAIESLGGKVGFAFDASCVLF